MGTEVTPHGTACGPEYTDREAARRAHRMRKYIFAPHDSMLRAAAIEVLGARRSEQGTATLRVLEGSRKQCASAPDEADLDDSERVPQLGDDLALALRVFGE